MDECVREASFGGRTASSELDRLPRQKPPTAVLLQTNHQSPERHRSDLAVALRIAAKVKRALAMLPTMLAVSSLAPMDFQ